MCENDLCVYFQRWNCVNQRSTFCDRNADRKWDSAKFKFRGPVLLMSFNNLSQHLRYTLILARCKSSKRARGENSSELRKREKKKNPQRIQTIRRTIGIRRVSPHPANTASGRPDIWVQTNC